MDAIFPVTGDIGAINMMVADYCRLYFPPVPYRRMLSAQTYDDLHAEAQDAAKTFSPDIPVHGFVVPADEAHPFKAWGFVERVRDTTLFVCVPHLIDSGLAFREPNGDIEIICGPGDRFVWSRSVVYEVLEWRRGPGWANTDIPIFYQATAELWRPDSLSAQLY
ncbi:MAG: hypothetical protein M0P55_14700 [Clostridiales bacterium]|nr:hypothetical protein [Clostridiales bacterium]